MPDGSSIESYLAEHGSLTYSNVGVSMLPLLRQGRDLFTVRAKGADRCMVGDVVLYRRNGRLVLHRVVEVRENDYVILGDNCVNYENGVTDADIIGVMTGFVRDGVEHTVDEPRYLRYSRRRLRMAPLRIALRRLQGKLGVKKPQLFDDLGDSSQGRG